MKIRVQGNRILLAAPQDTPPGVTVKARVQVRGARASTLPVELDLAPNDVVELVAEDGMWLWLRPEELDERLARDVVRGRAATGEE